MCSCYLAFSPPFLNKLVHKSTNTGLGSTTSAPRDGDIEDKEREVRAGRFAGRSQGSGPRACENQRRGKVVY